MSIIADTLNRLQARSSPAQSGQPDTSQRFVRQHEGPPTARNISMPSKNFLLVALGLVTGLGSIGIAGFWIGWNLDLEPSPVSTVPLIKKEGLAFSSASPATPQEAEQALPQNDLQEMSSSSTKTLPPILPTVPSVAPAGLTQPDKGEKSLSDQDIMPAPPTPARVNGPEVSQSEQSPTQPESAHSLQRQPAKQATPVSITSPVTTTSTPKSGPPEQSETESVAITDTGEKDPNPGQNSSDSPLNAEDPVNVTPEDSPATTEPAMAVLLEEKIMEEPFSSTESLHTSPSFLSEPEERVPVSGSIPKVPQARTTSPVSLENSMRQGKYLIRAGQYEEALAVLSTLFENPPENWEPWFWMGTAFLGKGDLEQADQYFLSGLARNDKVPQMWIQRALVAQQRGEYQLAIHELRQAESLQPDLPHLHLNMGYAYDQLGNNRLANQYYGKFMQLSEGNPEFFSTRKKILDRLTQASPSKSP